MARLTSPATSIDYILLGLLSNAPCHGYELHKQLTDLCGIGLLWRIKQPNLYALLEKLERRGWTQVVPGGEDTHPTRKQFGLTAEGERVFTLWLHSPVRRLRDMRQDFLARLYFAQQVSDSLVRALIQQQGLVCQGWLHSLERELATFTDRRDYQMSVCQFRVEQVRAMITWLDWVWESYPVQEENR
ncbi:MAG TPA: PadR family transcriptional regulator [Anaerolineaceae bacterium]|nr:PadR family transcriptional regulator [Anaerolineaceae bacterium]